MSNYLVKRLQRLRNCAAGYFLCRYANAVDAVNLSWLPTLEGIEYNIIKLTYQGLNDKIWLSYLSVKIVTQKRTLRSNFKIKLKTLSTNYQLIFDQMKVK